MGSGRSVEQMLAQLETKIAHHRTQQAFHMQQEALHREQKALHEAELQSTLERFEAFQAAAAAAGEILEREKAAAVPVPARDSDLDLAKGWPVSRMMALILEGKAADEVFGASSMVQEIHKRWGQKLRRKVSPRSASATLRRWAQAGRIHMVRDGKTNYESLYTKVARPAGER